MPVFVTAQDGVYAEISSMPGIYQHDLANLPREIDAILAAGIGLASSVSHPSPRRLSNLWGTVPKTPTSTNSQH